MAEYVDIAYPFTLSDLRRKDREMRDAGKPRPGLDRRRVRLTMSDYFALRAAPLPNMVWREQYGNYINTAPANEVAACEMWAFDLETQASGDALAQPTERDT